MTACSLDVPREYRDKDRPMSLGGQMDPRLSNKWSIVVVHRDVFGFNNF